MKYKVLKGEKNIYFFKILRVYLYLIFGAAKHGCNGDFAPVLEIRTHNVKLGKQESH